MSTFFCKLVLLVAINAHDVSIVLLAMEDITNNVLKALAIGRYLVEIISLYVWVLIQPHILHNIAPASILLLPNFLLWCSTNLNSPLNLRHPSSDAEGSSIEEGLDCPKEPAINLVHVAHAILEHDTFYNRIEAHFILCSIYKRNKNSDEIIEFLPRLWDNKHLCRL